MSPSKATEEPRGPKCSRCRHHGIIVPLKGHRKRCPFLSCVCWKCYLITQRTRITSLHSRAQNEEQRPAGRGTFRASALDGNVHQPAAPGLPPAEAPERGTASASCHGDLRSRPAAGDIPYLSDFGQILPVVHVPLTMPGYCPSNYISPQNFMLNMPWSPPQSAGLYNNSNLCGPQMFPHFHSGALYFPAPPYPGPIVDYRRLIRTPPPPQLLQVSQEEVTAEQHPQPSLSNIEELD